MNDLDVGKKLRKYREERHITVRDLAQKAGITASLLSQIERGITNPSINTLREISTALNIPMYCFFKEDTSERELVVRKPDRQIIGTHGNEVVYEKLTPGVMGSIEFVLMRIPQGIRSSDHMHSHTGEETAMVLSGTVELTIEDKVYCLRQGDSVRIPSGYAHLWTNPTKEGEALVIFAITPPSF